MPNNFDQEFHNWIKQEKLAIELSTLCSNLSLDKAVEVVLFRKPLVNTKPTEILTHHLYASKVSNLNLNIQTSVEIVQEMNTSDLAPSRIDLGKLLTEWHTEGDNYQDIHAFLVDKLADFIGKGKIEMKPKDVILYGFGRIGRLLARELVEQAGRGDQLRLKAIVTRGNSDLEIKKRAELLRNDSVHGAFTGTIVEDYANKCLIINGHTIHMINSASPDGFDYTVYGINDALVIDNTGVWRDREGLSRHLSGKGVNKVLLTAPGKGDIQNIVFGINHENQDVDNETVFSAASCTTNAIVPVLKVINDTIGIEQGHIETVHSYTNDQNLLDNFHKKERRGRAATLNMVITETGAGTAVSKALPELLGKISGNAVRVPTPDVSLAILHLSLNANVTKEQINTIIKDASFSGKLIEQIEYSINDELVSSDIIGNAHASIVDSHATIVSPNGKNTILYVWYDNEYGYTRQVVRLAKHISKVIRLRYY